MKRTFSIFVTALILFFSVMNINPVAAEVLGTDCKANKSIKNIKYINNTEYSIKNTSNITQNNEETNQVVEVFNHNSKQLYITGEDIDLMAKLVAAESIGEPYEGKVAVASVVLNRTVSSSFPNTIKEVIFQKNAFSCVKNGKIKSVANQDCYNAVYDAIKGYDPSNDALFFYNPATATCNWMKTTKKVNEKTIGHHTFFKLKA
ncbi:cell wall hydrolase [Clostridium sp. SM-530-WT-3G]|uniref:cell wall hydrolase n=1 Tax=Clostridium sp. SM-530-WT-3G TaxID=2725303 RepID=UPI00145FBD4E|nr:cell wall hydrolase [Clostridium sp. SM-530-WT-3G]NME83526.1 cell wall hydrolase [Clostridium sp. SM-530-WT-3G]